MSRLQKKNANFLKHVKATFSCLFSLGKLDACYMIAHARNKNVNSQINDACYRALPIIRSDIRCILHVLKKLCTFLK